MAFLKHYARDKATTAGAKLRGAVLYRLLWLPGSPYRGNAACRSLRGERSSSNFNHPESRHVASAPGSLCGEGRRLAPHAEAPLRAEASSPAFGWALPGTHGLQTGGQYSGAMLRAAGGALREHGGLSPPPAPRAPEAAPGPAPPPPGTGGRRLRAAAARCRPRRWRRPQPAAGCCLF